MGGIKLKYVYIPQSIDEDKLVSLFNKVSKSKLKPPKKADDDSESDDEFLNYDFALNDDGKLKDFNPTTTKIMVETDKRRLQ